MRTVSLFVPMLTLFFTSCGLDNRAPLNVAHLKEAWDANNDPLNLRDHYDVSLAHLPTRGELEHKPWTDTYWPSYRGGLANRWQVGSSNAFTYALKSETAVRAMSPAELARLSPAEKYDIFVGRYDYPLVASERERTSADDPSWFGLCHGWAPASMNFLEPAPVTVAGAGGIQIPFGSSDVKALLTYVQQEGEDTRFLGRRCNADFDANPEAGDTPACRDTNAGSFHVVVANQIGELGRSFVAEVNRDYQIWNQPVYGYESELLSESTDVPAGSARGTVKIVNVQTTLRYIAERGPSWDALPFSAVPSQGSSMALSYRLELDAQGDIIGGEWLSDARPDFLWTQAAPTFDGYLADVETIYESSISH